jgi:hypothetical protein
MDRKLVSLGSGRRGDLIWAPSPKRTSFRVLSAVENRLHDPWRRHHHRQGLACSNGRGRFRNAALMLDLSTINCVKMPGSNGALRSQTSTFFASPTCQAEVERRLVTARSAIPRTALATLSEFRETF